MTESLLRRKPALPSVSPWLWWTGLFLLFAFGPATTVLSQQRQSFRESFSAVGDSLADADEAQDGVMFSDAFTGRSGQAFGALFRAGYLTGPSVGREKGLAPIEAMPYFFLDRGLFFVDLRGFRNDAGYFGANTGLGYRQYIEPWDRIFGVNFYYDYDDTSSQLFQQMGFGLESYGEMFDIRANAYFPYGNQKKLLKTTLVDGSQTFSAHNLLYSTKNTYGIALKGMDAEVGVPFPSPMARRHDLRLFAGGYHYESQDTGGINGWSGRLQGNLIPSLQLQLQLTHDPVFRTNVFFGVTWSYGGFRQPEGEPKNQFDRMTTPVRRQYNISVAQTDVVIKDILAINPATGLAYNFEHVASYAPAGGDGTYENPYQTIGQAGLLNPGDIVFVHADSVFNGTIAANDNVLAMQSGTNTTDRDLWIRYLGDGKQDNGTSVIHTVDITGIGKLTLPQGTTGDPGLGVNDPQDRPQFLLSAGDAVTLASNAEFSGFVIGDPNDATSGPTGNGIFGNGGVHNIQLAYDNINFAQGDGIQFNNAGSNITLNQTKIFNSSGIGLNVLNGTPVITFIGDQIANSGDITATGGPALVVENTLAGSSVFLKDADIIDTNSASTGIFINNVAGSVTVGAANITNPGTFGLQILNSSGNFTFSDNLIINNPTDDGINITNLAAGGIASFSDTTKNVTINGRNAGGVTLDTIDGTVQFLSTVNVNTPTSGASSAITWDNSGGLTQFRNINISGSGGDGIDLGVNQANSGFFTVTGVTNINSTINGVAINIQDNTADSIITFNNNVNVNSRGNILPLNDGTGIQVHGELGTVNFNGTTTVQNPNLVSLNPAVDVQDSNGSVNFATLIINDATSNGVGAYGAGLNIGNLTTGNPGTVAVDLLNVTTTDGIGLFGLNAGDISATATTRNGINIFDGSINATGLQAVEIQNSAINITLASVTSADSVNDGIHLQNNYGTGTTFDFSVLGSNLVAQSGGIISNAAGYGVDIENSGSVTLRNMAITGSGLAGVRSRTTSSNNGNLFLRAVNLDMLNDQITGSGEQAIYIVDNQIVDLVSLELSGNGVNSDSTFNDIRYIVNTTDADPTVVDQQVYLFILTDSTILTDALVDDFADNIFISNVKNGDPDLTTTATDAFLVANILRNTINVGNSSDGGLIKSGLTVNWDGAFGYDQGSSSTHSVIELNDFALSNGGKTGIRINTPSLTTASFVDLLQNTIRSTITADQDTGLNISTGGPARFVIDGIVGDTTSTSTIDFSSAGVPGNGSTSQGMVFNLAQSSNVTIANTDIFLGTDFAEGIVFTNVVSPNVQLDITNNLIQFTNTSLAFPGSGYGIDFQNISQGAINVSTSGATNVVLFPITGTQAAFNPNVNAGLFNGVIVINNQTFP